MNCSRYQHSVWIKVWIIRTVLETNKHMQHILLIVRRRVTNARMSVISRVKGRHAGGVAGWGLHATCGYLWGYTRCPRQLIIYRNIRWMVLKNSIFTYSAIQSDLIAQHYSNTRQYQHNTFLAPLTTSAQRSWWYYWLSVVRRPSVNFCFKSLLLLQFLFENSEFFTGETRHIVPPCNKAGISNFCLEFQKLQKFQISWKRYSSYSSYSIILNFLLEKLGI